jgi:hypothetical protein
VSQREALHALDADIHADLASIGFAETGGYLPPNAAPDAVPTPARVYVDKDRVSAGTAGTVSSIVTEIGFLLEDVHPRRGGLVTVDGQTYRIEGPATSLATGRAVRSVDDRSVAWYAVQPHAGVTP